MNSLEERISALEAREAIKELRARYAWSVVQADAEGVAATFTEDGAFVALENGVRSSVSPRFAILDRHRRRLVPGKMLPMVHNEIIEVSGEEATSTCVMESPPTEANPAGSVVYYRDRLRRVDGEWLFSERSAYFLQPVFEAPGGAGP